MRTCVICRFETELDDVAISGAADRCICLRCFGEQTGTALRMPRELRRELVAAVAAID